MVGEGMGQRVSKRSATAHRSYSAQSCFPGDEHAALPAPATMQMHAIRDIVIAVSIGSWRLTHLRAFHVQIIASLKRMRQWLHHPSILLQIQNQHNDDGCARVSRMLLIHRVAILMLAACTSVITGCRGDDRPSVVLYVSADDYVAREVVQAFETQTGIRVMMVGDIESKKTTGLVERLRAEKDDPQADVFWSSELFMTIELADEGVLEPYESEATRDWPEMFRDPDRRWYGFAARGRVIVYSPNRVPAEEVPRTWMALTNDRFRGRLVMADPRFGTTGGHLAAMKAYWDRNVMPGYYAAFLEGLAENQTRLLASGNAGVVEAVARGEADVGMTDTDDVWAAQARGLEVDLVYPSHSAEADEAGVGTLLIPNTVARVAGGPNPEAAGRLIDFLLSEQVERLLAESVSHNVPLRPGLADDYPEYAIPDPLRVDYRLVAKLRQDAVRQAMRTLRRDEPPAIPAEPDDDNDDDPASAPLDADATVDDGHAR